MEVYEITKMVIEMEAYDTKEDYQKRLDIFLAIQELSVEQYQELTKLLQSK